MKAIRWTQIALNEVTSEWGYVEERPAGRGERLERKREQEIGGNGAEGKDQ